MHLEEINVPYIEANICLQVEEKKKKYRSEKYILSYLNTQTKNQMLSSDNIQTAEYTSEGRSKQYYNSVTLSMFVESSQRSEKKIYNE